MPPNWDSWGKIRVLGGTFDAEVISQGWAEDIKMPLGSTPHSLETLEQEKAAAGETGELPQEHSAIAQYEDWCREPTTGGLPPSMDLADEHQVSVASDDTQEFLEKQHKLLEAFKAKAPDVTGENALPTRADKFKDGGVSDHIGPVQFNMGGIQVDADDMLQQLKVRIPVI